MTNSVHSVHGLVRLLKASTDPPSTPGLSKIEIARLAWLDTSFRAANKGEVIGEWILTLLGQATKTKREKDANSTSDPVTDSRYWALLCDVLTAPPTTAARSIKTWLLPLLNRFQLDAIVNELFTSPSLQVLAPARTALGVLWPLAEKKIGVDALGECLSLVLDICGDWERVDENLGWICSVVVNAYRNALANAGNKKKLYSFFLTTHLSSWLRVICSRPSVFSRPSSTELLQESIYAAGTDTLLSLDALKQPLDTLFDALSSSTSILSSVILVLPKLFASFLSATQRHKSALFVSAVSVVGGKEEIRKRGMNFVGKCWVLIRDSTSLQEELEVEKWKSLVDIFEIVEKERLFIPHSVYGRADAQDSELESELALNEARDKAVGILETANPLHKGWEEHVVLSTQLLDVLVRIEYNLVGCVLERVLSTLINIPLPLIPLTTGTFSEFLTHVLDYHSKTRTVHTYASALLDAILSAVTSSFWASSTQSTTRPFPLSYHVPALARALRTSLTPTQTAPLVTAVLQAVKIAWIALKDAAREEERNTKKRKVTGDVGRNRHEAGSAVARVRAFSYTCRIAGTILSNLHPNVYASEGEYSLQPLLPDAGELGWTIVRNCLGQKSEKDEEHDTVKGRERKKRKHMVEPSPLSAHYAQIAAAASLRFLYDIRARVSLLLGDSDRLGEADVETLLNVVRDEVSDPELVLETVRTLLWHMWFTYGREFENQIEIQPAFTTILDILTSRPLSGAEWSGVSATLTRDNLGLAVLYVLVDRWMDVLDALASTENLERLLSTLLAASLDSRDEDAGKNPNEICLQRGHVTITLRGILISLLRNAQFWELRNIRAVFLSSVLTQTEPLSHGFPAAEAGPPLPTIAAQTALELACDMYELILYVPPEYFTRLARAELIKRAMSGDIHICKVLQYVGRKGIKPKEKVTARSGFQGISRAEDSDDRDSAKELRSWSRRLMYVRVFLQRMGQFLDTTGHATSLAYVDHLLSPCLCLSLPSESFTTATLDLIQLHIVSLLHSQEPEAAASVARIISTLATARPFSQPNSQETWAHAIVQSSIIRLFECLTSDFDPSNLHDRVKRALNTLVEGLESALSSQMQNLVESDSVWPVHFSSSERIHAWSRTLSLTRWSGTKPQVTSVKFGPKLVASMIRRGHTAELDFETCSSVLGLLLEELWCMPDDSHRDHLDLLVGFYVVNGGNRDSDFERAMDAHVTQASKKLAVHDFSHVLDVLAEAVGGGGFGVGQRERLIHLGRVMLHDGPQGTLKVIQKFTTRCFSLFVDREEIYGRSSQLKLQCLEFIAKHCSDRPAAVRSVDLSSIWSFLHKMLFGSSEHDATTTFLIFHHIVTIIGALIRLRRDLVVHTLPHLSGVLCQLVSLTRKIRPQLGAKQSKMVTDTFPSWLSASQPLSPDDAHALARLLTTLTTKTVPRTHAYAHTLSTEPQKAASLAKPFAKHASYVLIAYVTAFNDPLCILDAETRRALEPGLFALCEMVGEHSRDALMLSALDSGGKTILKLLWREYDKQRYVGGG